MAAESPCCTLCTTSRLYRRGLCRSCHRKLSEAGIELPPANGGHPAFVQWLRRWPAEQQQKLKDALLLILTEGTR